MTKNNIKKISPKLHNLKECLTNEQEQIIPRISETTNAYLGALKRVQSVLEDFSEEYRKILIDFYGHDEDFALAFIESKIEPLSECRDKMLENLCDMLAEDLFWTKR